MQLLTDVFIIENLQVLEEGNKDGKMRICGIFGRAEEENNNGRIYPNKVLGGQVGTLQDLISERRLCGELDHPQNETVKLSNASHLITKLEMRGNDLMGEAEILKTPAGLTAQALINGGVKIGISSRGMGTLSEDYQGKKVVNEDYKLVTFDLVADPSTKGAFPSLSESTESCKKTRKIVNDTYKKALGEKVFVTMLKESFKNSLEEADKPYESDKLSYDEVMKMRGYPSVEEIMSRGDVKEDPFYKAMMAAVKGATPVKAKESKTPNRADRAKHKAEGLGKFFGPVAATGDEAQKALDATSQAQKRFKKQRAKKRAENANTQPTYNKMVEFLAEAQKKKARQLELPFPGRRPLADFLEKEIKSGRAQSKIKKKVDPKGGQHDIEAEDRQDAADAARDLHQDR